MNGTTCRQSWRLVGVIAMVMGLATFASPVAAQEDDGSDPAIVADVVADIVVEGGDAQGGNAQGGNAVVSLEVGNTSGNTTGDSQVAVVPTTKEVKGGAAIGGDAVGGDGLDAYVEADLIVNADVGVEVTADVNVTTGLSADAALPDAGSGTLGGGSDVAAASQPASSEGASPLQNGVSSASEEVSNILSPLLGALSGLQLLDLNVDLVLEVSGGDAVGGNATGGNAVVDLKIGDTTGPGQVTVAPNVGTVTGGLVMGGDATGGTGIVLDVILDADVDLVVDVLVAIEADATTFAEAGAETSDAADLGELAID